MLTRVAARYELQTVKESQGRGLGAALVEETMKMAQMLKLTKVVLTCLKREYQGAKSWRGSRYKRCLDYMFGIRIGNVPALRFYEKHG